MSHDRKNYTATTDNRRRHTHLARSGARGVLPISGRLMANTVSGAAIIHINPGTDAAKAQVPQDNGGCPVVVPIYE